MATSEQFKADMRNILRLFVLCMLAILYFGYVFPVVLSFWLTLYGNAFFQFWRTVYGY